MSLETRHAILNALLTCLDEEHAIGLMDHRKAKKAPLTPLATKILLKQLRLCPDPNEAVEEMINRNWTGLKADWLKKPAKTTGRRTFTDVAMDRFNAGSASVQGSGSDAGEFSPDERQSRFDGERLRIGDSRPFVASRH